MNEKEILKKINKELVIPKTFIVQDFIKAVQSYNELRFFLYSLAKSNSVIIDHGSFHINEEKTKSLKKLLWSTAHNLDEIYEIIFPLSEREKDVGRSWDSVDLIDAAEIGLEAEKYTDPSNVDNMTLEETLKLIEEHNPSFAKAKREELAAQNFDNPDPSQPTE